MRSGRRVIAAATLFVAACGYPSFDFLPDDSSVAPIDSSIDDAGGDATYDTRDAPTDTRVDSVADTNVIDTGVVDTRDTSPPPPDTFVVDTGIDAVDGHVAGCSDYPTAVFCDDWDTSPPGKPEAKWTGTYAVNGGVLLMDAGDASPNSFLSRIVATTSGAEESATLYQPIIVPTLTTTVQLDVDVKLGAATYPAGDGIVLAKVGKPGGRGFDLGLGPTGFYVETLGTSSGGGTLTTPVPVDRWFHVRLKGTLMTSGAKVDIWVDDPSSTAYSATGVSTATVDDLNEQVTIGVYSNLAPFAAFDAHFDTAAVTFP